MIKAKRFASLLLSLALISVLVSGIASAAGTAPAPAPVKWRVVCKLITAQTRFGPRLVCVPTLELLP